MRLCQTCQKPIGHTNGNRKTCFRCQHEPRPKPRVQKIEIELEYFLKLLEDSKELDYIKKQKDELEIVQMRWEL
jgi:hypothetical protein